jgi:hypothetical protein
MTNNIRPLHACAEAVKHVADPNTSRIVYVDRQPLFEISRRDGKYWIRDFGSPRSNPFRPLCKDSLAFHVQELIEACSKPAGGWQ